MKRVRLRMLAVGLMWGAAILIFLCFFLGWYTEATSSTDGTWPTAQQTFYPMWVDLSADAYGSPSSPFSEQSNYSAVDLAHTGELYNQAALGLVAGIALLGVSGTLLVFGRVPRLILSAPLLATVAGVLLIAMPIHIMQAQPAAMCSESQVAWTGPPPPQNWTPPSPDCGWELKTAAQGSVEGSPYPPGPQATFSGSEALTANSTLTWGPSTGWFLAFGSGGVALAGASVGVLSWVISRPRAPSESNTRTPSGSPD